MNPYNFVTDEYGTLYNDPQNFDTIAEVLHRHGSMVIAWTDNLGTQLDLLLVVAPIQVGPLQGGQSAHSDLFVSALRLGSGFGFDINGPDDLHPNYVAEKLQINGGSTVDRLTVLIGEVRRRLR